MLVLARRIHDADARQHRDEDQGVYRRLPFCGLMLGRR
jgi:hypothetical protein